MGLFSAMAEEFDFDKLLMRNSSEIPNEALELAVHDMSLTEFIGSDGVPAPLARKLIDQAWPLHEKQGTDEGVKLGQNLLGIGVEITHWWQQEPRAPHDTHTIALNLGDADTPPEVPLGLEVQKTALKTVEATKRYSQDSSIVWKSVTRANIRLGANIADHHQTSILPPIITDLQSKMPLTIGGILSFGETIRIRPISPASIESNGPIHAAVDIRPIRNIVKVYPHA